MSSIGSHFRRVAFSALGSEVLPAFVRMRVLRALGAQIDPTVCIWGGCRLRSHRLVLGREVFINVGFFHDGTETLTVGDNVRMGQFVSVITASHNIGSSEQRCEVTPVYGEVVIEKGCWIGANVTIMPGVVIRNGCVVGAGSIVFESTEPDGLYAGTPARRVKDLPP